MRGVRVPLLAWFGVLALAFVAYLPALRVGWVLDDTWNIVSNPALHWTEISAEGFRQVREQTLNSGRDAANLSFALNHLVGGLDPFGFHLVNVLIHLLVGTALLWLAWEYLQSVPVADLPSRRAWMAAVVPAALFLVHPLNTQAVTYVVQRMASLAALFCVLSLAAYLRGRREPRAGRAVAWFVVAALAWALALGSKENAAALPLVVLVWEWCFRRAQWVDRWRRAAPLAKVGVAAVVSVSVVGVGRVVWRYVGGPARWLETLPARDFSPLERVLTQARVNLTYLGQLVWPAPGSLNLDHDVVVSRGLLDPITTLPAVLFWVVAVGGAVVLARRKPLLGFPLLAYVGFHLVEAGPLNLELMHEHRMYLPMTMLALFGTATLVTVRVPRWRMVLAGAGTVATALGVLTFTRNALWADPIAFHRDIAEKSPKKARAHGLLASALLEADRPLDAIAPAERAVELEPDYKALMTLGDVYLAAERFVDAEARYRQAVELAPRAFEAEYRIGLVLEQVGDTAAAYEHFTRIGVEFGMAGAAFEAIYPLERAVRLRPGSSEAHNHLGNAYALAGRADKALAEYRRAVELDGRNAEALYNLARTEERAGNSAAALEHYRRFLEVAPPSLARPRAQAAARIRELGSALAAPRVP
jgi:Flp pilus assembly protein TadD